MSVRVRETGGSMRLTTVLLLGDCDVTVPPISCRLVRSYVEQKLNVIVCLFCSFAKPQVARPTLLRGYVCVGMCVGMCVGVCV